DQIDVARQVDLVYDFAMPPLMLHTIYTRSAAALKRWLQSRPRNALTVLDTHDGIGVVDVNAARGSGARGLLTRDEVDTVVTTIHQRSRGESRIAIGSGAGNGASAQITYLF